MENKKTPISEFKGIRKKGLEFGYPLGYEEDHHPWILIEILFAYISVRFPNEISISVLVAGEFSVLHHVFLRYEYACFHICQINNKYIKGKGDELQTEWVLAVREVFIALFEIVSENPQPKVKDQVDRGSGSNMKID